MSLSAGTTLGPYEVIAKIGEGGMGEVYQARDTKLDRDVALKVLSEAFTSDPDRLARFEREAKVLASLNHPNIGSIYGLEETEGVKALVLELIEGPTLADRIKQGPIPIDEALPIAKQIAEALEAAHEAGVIHRDLKPANIKVRDDSTVKVLDFGLAKALDPAPTGDPDQSPTLTAAATQMGAIMGTAAYMSPEQARGKPVDKRADVWAFGVVLLEMLTGRKVFEGEDVSMTLASVLQREPDWSHLPSDVSPALSVFLNRCLEKDPKQRVPDIATMRLALGGAFEATVGASSEVVSSSPVAVWQRPVPLLLAGLVLSALTAVGVWGLTRPTAPRVARFAMPLAADQAFYGGRRAVAISPDGSQVVYNANLSLWLRPVDQLRAVQVGGTEEGGVGPFFSADGKSVGFWARGSQLQTVPVTGGAPVRLAEMAEPPFGASWGADDMILYAQADGIWQVPGAGATPEVVIPADEDETMHGPQMLPGGEWVLFTARATNRSWDEAQIVVQSAATGERTVLIVGGRDGSYVSTGHLVYGLNNVLMAAPFDVDSHEITGGSVPLVEGVRAVGAGGGALHFSVSTSGSLVYIPDSAGGATRLSWVGRDGDEETIPAPPRAYGHPRVSPDGTRVAVDVTDGNSRDIWIWDLVREALTQFTFDEAEDAYPLWTPDSARLLFTSSREGGGLFWKAADGTGPVERLKDGLARPYGWAADGRLIFEEDREIGVLSVEGQPAVEMLLDAGEPALSPDGRWLAYISDETGTPVIYVKPFPNIDDGLWNVSNGVGINPVWAPDGRELFYMGLPGRNLAAPGQSDLTPSLMVAQIETGPTFSARTPEPLFSLSAYAVSETRADARPFDLAPDGDRFIFRKSDESVDSLIFVQNWLEELKARVPVN